MPDALRIARPDAAPSKAPPAAVNSASVRWSSWLVYATVALAPLSLGSVGAAVPAIWSIVLGVALLGLLPVRLRREQRAVLAGAAGVAIACLFVLHEQLAAKPWLPVHPDPLWARAARLLGTDLPASVSIARNQPFFSLGLGIVCSLAFATALLMASDREAARRLLRVVAISGTVYAVAGVATFLIEPTKIFLLYEKQAHLTALTSPFVNRNTAAVYYGCCALIWLMLGSERLQQLLPSERLTWARARARLSGRSGRSVLMPVVGWLVCLIAMFLTGSRAGAGISLVAMILAVVAFLHRRLSGWYVSIGAWLAGVLIALALLQLFGGVVGGRLSVQGFSDEGRLSTYRAVLRMINDHPWLGSGFGTFEMAYPAYRTDDISLAGIWNRAHNSLLELASDGGLVLAGVVVAGALAAFAVLVRGIRTRRRDVIVPVVALCAALAATAHSMVDFSLQIPGYAIVIFSLLGAGMSQSFGSQTRLPRVSGATNMVSGGA